MKGVDFPVRRNFPAFAPGPGIGAGGFRIEPRQSFKHADDDAQFRLAGDDGRVERFRFGIVDDGEVGGRLAPDAAGSQKTEDESERTKWPSTAENALSDIKLAGFRASGKGAFQNATVLF